MGIKKGMNYESYFTENLIIFQVPSNLGNKMNIIIDHCLDDILKSVPPGIILYICDVI